LVAAAADDSPTNDNPANDNPITPGAASAATAVV
jgi:hypothetical protein